MRFLKDVISIFTALSVSSSAIAAGPNFLWNSGTANNGQIATTLVLLGTADTGFNSLTNGSVVVSSNACTSGVCSNSNTAQAVWGEVLITLGAVTACSTGANIAGWFLQSIDGTTFEPTAAAPARAPDFMIPLPATTLGATYKASSVVRIPALKFKTMIQNNCGQTLAASGNTLNLGLIAVQY